MLRKIGLGRSSDARLLVDQLRERGIAVSPDPLARLLETATTDVGRGFLMVARDGGRVVGVR